jgi:hypothetical protein
MNTIRKQQGQVLVILVGALFLGGAGLAAGVMASGDSLKTMKKSIKSLQLDDAREDRALDVLKRWKKAAKPVHKAHSKTSDQILKLLKNQHTTADDLAAIFSSQADHTNSAEVQVVAFRDELRAILSQSEWDRVFASQ